MIDREDWNKPWFNKSIWIFENMQDLNLNPTEALVLLVLNFFNETETPVSYDALMDKCHLSAEAIEDSFESLSAKGYLTLDTRNKGLKFLLDGLVDSPVKAGTPINKGLISEFQEEFGRTLSSSDIERILEMAQKYDERMILQALSEASAYGKRTLGYVETVLNAWKERKLTVEDVEHGRR